MSTPVQMAGIMRSDFRTWRHQHACHHQERRERRHRGYQVCFTFLSLLSYVRTFSDSQFLVLATYYLISRRESINQLSKAMALGKGDRAKISRPSAVSGVVVVNLAHPFQNTKHIPLQQVKMAQAKGRFRVDNLPCTHDRIHGHTAIARITLDISTAGEEVAGENTESFPVPDLEAPADSLVDRPPGTGERGLEDVAGEW